jgi:diguanylate cyclase (GGDEF)-like protein/PAS domain S-box-containing protein
LPQLSGGFMRFRLSFHTVLVVALAAVLAAGFYFGARAFVGFVSAAGADLEKKALVSVAVTAAAALEASEVAKLSGPGQDVTAPAFRTVRRELRRLHDAVPGVRFVYLAGRKKNGALMFLCDAENMSSKDYSPPGQVYTEAPEKFHQVFDTHRAAIEGPYRDRWGEWTSGLAPVIDPASGKVLAVVGFDVPAAAWNREVGRYRLFAEALAGLAGALIAVFGIAGFYQARVRGRIARLNDDLKMQVNELALSNRIVENSSTIVFRIDLGDSQPLTYVSRNIDHYGYIADDLLHAPHIWRGLFHPGDQVDIQTDIERLAKGEADRSRRELRFRKADGSWAWIDGRLAVVRDAMGRRVALEGIMFDITERKKAEEQIAHLATHDALTGLANRAAFLERLQMAFAETRRSGVHFAVLYLDVDRFKDVNDAFGHDKGDLLLQAVAQRLTGALRETDVLGRFSVARFGGDEFAVLQTAVSDPGDAAALAQRLIKVLAEPFAITGNEIHITISIGISLHDSSVAEPSDMLMQADLALYRAKDAGRNQFHFHSANLDIEVRERVAIGEDLHAAIEKDELELHYQPQVEIPSGRIIGMEALIRWNHPVRGTMGPEMFISVAEKTGIINALGDWVIRRACLQIRDWRADGLVPPPVGVNVSAVQFDKSTGLMDAIKQALAESAVEAAMLEVELTESVLAETATRHSGILTRLRELGLSIAVDDFGTGYSSLQYLHSYPIGRIKIAQQFMREVTGEGGDAAIVRAVIELGRALKLDVVAEGVETAAQAEFLLHAGCHIVQGFYFSPPVPAADMAVFLRKGAFAYPHRTERMRAGAA